jgi:hypothetical protein
MLCGSFCGQEDAVQRIFTKKCLHFTAGSVCRVELLTTVEKFARSSKVADDVAGFDTLIKRWNKCINIGGGYVEKYFFYPRFEYHMFYVLYSFL